MRNRYCYFCGGELNLSEFIIQNYHLSRKYLMMVWDHPSIELLCCHCFKIEALKQKNICFEGKVK